jgi:hypothetical protein
MPKGRRDAVGRMGWKRLGSTHMGKYACRQDCSHDLSSADPRRNLRPPLSPTYIGPRRASHLELRIGRLGNGLRYKDLHARERHATVHRPHRQLGQQLAALPRTLPRHSGPLTGESGSWDTAPWRTAFAGPARSSSGQWSDLARLSTRQALSAILARPIAPRSSPSRVETAMSDGPRSRRDGACSSYHPP